uniref:Uncharacterized protein n=1 Tax=viral metagenome TaxID=1070528 RepID=A0A6M3L0Q2_9ZZZZ
MRAKINKELSNIKVEDKVVKSIYTDKKGFKITLELLENLLQQAKKVKKQPLLIISLLRNKKEVVTMKSIVSIERK